MLPHNSDARAAFWAGVRMTLIVTPSYVPFGVICGVASVNVGMSHSAALALPALVFGGSSQAVVFQFLQNSAAIWVAVLSGLVVNLRMAIYSAAMAPRLRHLSLGKRILGAAFLVDNTFAFLEQRVQTHPDDPYLLWYYAGMTAVLWPTWILFCAIGVMAGSVVPNSWQLDFAIPLSFIAMLALSVRNRPMMAAALVGGCASVLLFDLPLKLGLIAACFIGMAAGLLTEWTSRSKWTPEVAEPLKSLRTRKSHTDQERPAKRLSE
jgi:predicted branched-subunit amino acid permease